MKTIQLDRVGSLAMLMSVQSLACSFEESYWVYTLEKTWEQDRISLALGQGDQNALTIAEYEQHRKETMRLHDLTLDNIRKFWGLMASDEFDTTSILSSLNTVNSYYEMAFDSYEKLIEKAAKSRHIVPLLESYAEFIRYRICICIHP